MRRTRSSALPEGRLDTELDLRALSGAVWRKRRWIILPTLLAALGSILYVNSVDPLYRSTTLVLIERGESTFTRADRNERDQDRFDAETVASQVQLVQSRDLARRVAAELKLADNPEFAGSSGLSLSGLLAKIGLARSTTRSEERVLDNFAEHLTVYPVDKTRVIGIEFSSRDPELAARAANAVADAYIDFQRDAKVEQTRQATQWLSGEIEDLRKRVTEAENKVSLYRARSNLLVGTNNTTIAAQQLGDLNTQLAAARSAQAEAQAKAQLLRETLQSGRPFESSEIANSELIRRLVEQRVSLRAAIASEGRTLLAQHPRMKELNAQLADLDSQIRSEGEKLARAFETDAKVAGARVATLQSQMELQKQDAAQANEQDVQLRALEREAKAQRDLLEQFLGRYREASARIGPDALPADARIISRAAVPTKPYFPKTFAVILLATVAAFAVSLMLVATGELLSGGGVLRREDDDGHRDAEAPRALGEVPVYGRLRGLGNRRIEAEAPRPVADAADAEVVGALADQLAAMETVGKGMRILIAAASLSASPGRISMALARALAEAGRRTVIIEGETQMPPVAEGERRPGLFQLLAGTASFADVIHRDARSRVHYIPSGTDGAVILDAEAVERLSIALDALAMTYDFVVLLRPDMEGAVRLAEAELADAAILVAAGGAGDAGTVASHERLLETGVEDVIVLLVPGARAPGDSERLAA